MTELPPYQRLSRKDAWHMLALAPLESITRSLRNGDGWALEELTPFVNRCRALVAAYDARMNAQNMEGDEAK